MNDTFEEGAARIERAAALRPSVPLYRHMLYGSRLTNPLDFLVLMHIHFMCEDGKEFTVSDLIEALRAEGIRNANGKGDGLVGSKAVYESVGRLRAAGFLHRSQSNARGFGKVAYTFHEFPAQDPDWTPPPVPDSPADLPVPLTGEAVPAGNGKTAGRTASPHSASAHSGSAHRRTVKTDVSAGHTASPHRRSVTVSPPHPPEEVDTSSPYPLTTPDSGHPSQPEKEGEAPRFTEQQLRDARTFLGRLPQPFTVGRAKAHQLAPLLLDAIEDQGWKLDDQLAAELTKNPDGVRSGARVLEKDRIPNLVLWEMVHGRKPRKAAVRPSAARSAVDCDRGCDEGWIHVHDGSRPCACLPARATPAP